MTDLYGAQVRAQLAEAQAELDGLRSGLRLTEALLAKAQDERETYRAAWHSAKERASKWRGRAEQAEARIAAVRALHQPAQHLALTICNECSTERSTGPGRFERHVVMPWPCPTIAAIDNSPTLGEAR